MGRIAVDLTGKRFGRLVALRRAENSRNGKAAWRCLCDCGEMTDPIRSDHLVRGLRISCGCASVDPESNTNYALRSYKYGALIRGLIWELTKEQALFMFSQPCHYCGALPSILEDDKMGDVLVRNGIDRLDPGKGYNISNCVPCCSRCNYAKRDMSYDEFVDHIKSIYKNLFIK